MDTRHESLSGTLRPEGIRSTLGEKLTWHEYVGVSHIHTTDSDGSKSVPEIIKIGQKVGLDFLFFSDHMTLRSLHLGLEGWHGNTFVLIGYEIHDQTNQNHYLAFNINEVLSGELSAQEYVKEVKRRDGLGIIAHPDETRVLPQFPPYPWTAWDAEGFDGIEIWNQMSEWMEGINRLNQLKMFFSPRRYLTSPTPRILKIWDGLNKQRRVCGISGVDVHAYPYKLGPFTFVIFPYKVQFQSLRVHLILKKPLSSDNRIAKKQVIDAIRGCNLFISNYRWGDAKGFSFYAESKNKIARVGDSISSSNNVTFIIKTPQKCQIRLLRDGTIISESVGGNLEYSAKELGIYRVEAYKGKKGWVFSNHIRVE
ncbi:MAG: PHP domain-containing protein [candidate division Zixibacteria bacterium]|nr:PHP domain-containing protein [candidate division Zixibacteria bacterium]